MRTDFAIVTSLIEALDRRSPTADGRAESRSRHPWVGTAVTPPPRRPEASRSLLRTLLERSSRLDYADEPIPLLPILRLLQESLERDRLHWGNDDYQFEAFLFALRPLDCQPGVYRVTTNGVQLVGPGPDDPSALGVQREFAEAAAVVSVAANLDSADSSAGAHGYRLAMFRATEVVYSFHLSCVSEGLVGTVFAGFIPATARQLIRSDGVTRHQMFAVTVAQAATVTSTEAPRAPGKEEMR